LPSGASEKEIGAHRNSLSPMGVSVRDGPRRSNWVHTRRFFLTNLIFTSGGTRGSKPRKKTLEFPVKNKRGTVPFSARRIPDANNFQHFFFLLGRSFFFMTDDIVDEEVERAKGDSFRALRHTN
jgi:hypothetical protein